VVTPSLAGAGHGLPAAPPICTELPDCDTPFAQTDGPPYLPSTDLRASATSISPLPGWQASTCHLADSRFAGRTEPLRREGRGSPQARTDQRRDVKISLANGSRAPSATPLALGTRWSIFWA
jgi:hypothetical protein